MQLVYPAKGHSTAERSTFLLGCVSQGEWLHCNGEPVSLSPEGFFAHRVLLNPGENHFTLEPEQGEPYSCVITRWMPEPLTFEPDDLKQWSYPQHDMTCQPGQSVYIACLLPLPDMDVSVSIGQQSFQLSSSVSLAESRENVFGQLHQLQRPSPAGFVYAALIVVSYQQAVSKTPLEVQFVAKNAQQTYRWQAPGRIRLQEALPFVTVNHKNAIARTAPEQGSRLSPLMLGSTFPVLQQNGAWLSFSHQCTQAWIQQQDVTVAAAAPVYPLPVKLVHLQAQQAAIAFDVVIPLPYLPPVALQIEPDRVEVSLTGCIWQCDVIRLHPMAQQLGLQSLQWAQPLPQTVRLSIHLDSPCWGAFPLYDAQKQELRIRVRTQAAWQQSGLPYRVILDAGHGGLEYGAIAPEGTPEKTLNLGLQQKIREVLSQYDAIEVLTTRVDDIDVALNTRSELIQKSQAQLCLSLHHNALPDGRDPWVEAGVGTFYYHAFAQPMAQVLQQYMVQHTDFANYGLVYDSLHLCRIMHTPALLLECGFLTHPTDAAKCLDAAHQRKVATAIVHAILEMSQAGRQNPT